MYGIDASRMGRAFSPHSIPYPELGALPQAGMGCAVGAQVRHMMMRDYALPTAGTPTATLDESHDRLVSKRCPLLEGQRPEFIPAWGNAPGPG